MFQRFLLVVVLVVSGLLACKALAQALALPEFRYVHYTAPQESQIIGNVRFTPCRLSDKASTLYRDVDCAVVSVPENYRSLEGKQVQLFIVRIKTSAKHSKLDPMLLISGGPGQAATESFLSPWMGFQKIAKQRDIYLIDQRGTGKSSPLVCDGLYTESALDEKQTEAAINTCIAQVGADVAQYTTSVAVRDFEEIRKRLAIPQWNIYGISYGTRVAQHYLRRFPGAIRTVILDGVIAPNHILGTEVAEKSFEAFIQLAERCNSTPACANAFPQFEQGVKALFTRVKNKPITVIYEDFSTGKIQEFELTWRHLAGVLRLSLYSSEVSSIIPVVFHAAYAEQNYLPLVRLVTSDQYDIANVINLAMHHSVICTEDLPYVSDAIVDEVKASEAETYLGGFLDELVSVCRHWPLGVIDSDFKTLVATDKPVLLMSGSLDPITPPEYASAAAKEMKNSQIVVVNGFGHGVARVGCMPTLMAKFVDEKNVALDTSCLQKQTPNPIFIDFNGAMP